MIKGMSVKGGMSVIGAISVGLGKLRTLKIPSKFRFWPDKRKFGFSDLIFGIPGIGSNTSLLGTGKRGNC